MARIGIGVEEKQLETQCSTRRQKTSSLSCILRRGERRLASYKRTGARSDRASLWHR